MPYHAFLECPKCGGGFTIYVKYGEVCAEDGTPIIEFLNASADDFEDDEYDETDLVDRRFY